jgi:leucyl-tRNA---protein transferase
VRHEERTRLLARALERAPLHLGDAEPCPYLPGRAARLSLIAPGPLVSGMYHSLMDLNFRRLGPLFYRPECEGCRECRMIRVEVATFRPSRSQRRCLARNAELAVASGRPRATTEKHALYRRYLDGRHDGRMDGSLREFGVLYSSDVETLELVYTLRDRLMGVGLADIEPDAMSAVYAYFDPGEARRSLGTFNILQMLADCERRGLRYLYLGYYVRDCGRMSYKRSFRPCEVLAPDGHWTRCRMK